MAHTSFAPEQFELIADATKRLPDPDAVPSPNLLLDQGVASAIANAVYDRNNKRRGPNNYGNTPDTRFIIDVSELGSGHFPAPFLVTELPEDAGSGYRVHLLNAESDHDTWVINDTFAYAFQRILDREEYTQRVSGLVLAGYGAAMTGAVTTVSSLAGFEAIDTFGASPGIFPVFAIGGAVVGATCATGLHARDAYRRWVSNGNTERVINRRHMKATLGHIAKLGVDPVIYTDQKEATMNYTPRT